MRPEPPPEKYVDLTARDRHVVRAYVARPAGTPRGALVLLQQMDQRHPQWDGTSQRKHAPPSHRPGVNAFGRQMAEQFAADGYLVVAPSLFSRGLSGLDYGYRYDQTRWSVRLRRPLEPVPPGPVLLDVEAAIVHARRLAPHTALGVVGYCWGGLLAWRAASEFRALQAAVCHYGGGMERPAERALQPQCPVLAHFPSDGTWMSAQDVAAFIASHPATGGDRSVECQVHPAPYGFSQPGLSAYDEAAASRAHAQTLAFLETRLAASAQASAATATD